MNKIENSYYFFSHEKFDPYKFFDDLFPESNMGNNTSVTDESVRRPIRIRLSNQKFTYEYKKTYYKCEYYVKILNSDKTVYEIGIIFYYQDKKERAAEAFSQLAQNIKAEKKNQFNMVSIKDSLSIYFSQKLFTSLAVYEHSLRALILAMFVPIYKVSWSQELNTSVNKEILTKGNAKDRIE